MFCLFFSDAPVWSFADAAKSDLAAFRSFFHSCLEQGVYFAPSQFETGFLCLEHTAADLEKTAAVMEQALKRVRNARSYLIPASPETRGHGTTGMAKLWKQKLADWLETVPQRTPAHQD